MAGGRWRKRGRAHLFVLATFLIPLAILIAPLGSPARAGTVPAGFVYAQGTQLFLDGTRSNSTGSTFDNQKACGPCSYGRQAPAMTNTLQQIGSGQNAFRAWFFQNQVYSAAGATAQWAQFDQTISDAAAAGQKVIVTLGNQWGACDTPHAQYKDITWYQGGYKQILGPNETYAAWVQEVVTRYASSPAVAFWQLMNEPEAAAGFANGAATGCNEAQAATALQTWAADMATKVKAIDANHLLNIGSSGGGQCGTSYLNYQALNATPGNDLCEFHDYHDADNPIPGDQWNGLQARLSQCGSTGANKPIFVGETGILPSEAGTYAAGTAFPGDSGVGADPCGEANEGGSNTACQIDDQRW